MHCLDGDLHFLVNSLALSLTWPLLPLTSCVCLCFFNRLLLWSLPLTFCCGGLSCILLVPGLWLFAFSLSMAMNTLSEAVSLFLFDHLLPCQLLARLCLLPWIFHTKLANYWNAEPSLFGLPIPNYLPWWCTSVSSPTHCPSLETQSSCLLTTASSIIKFIRIRPIQIWSIPSLVNYFLGHSLVRKSETVFLVKTWFL